MDTVTQRSIFVFGHLLSNIFPRYLPPKVKKFPRVTQSQDLQSAKFTKNGRGEGVSRIRINLGVIGDVGNDSEVVPAGTQGLHGEILGGAELDVIPLVVSDGCGAVVVGHVVCLCCSCCHCWCPSKQAGQARSRQAWR